MSDYLILLLLADITKGIGTASFIGFSISSFLAYVTAAKDWKIKTVEYEVDDICMFFSILALTFLMILIFIPSSDFFNDAANVCKADKTQCISFRGTR